MRFSDDKNNWIFSIALIVIVFATFSPSLSSYFVNIDDPAFLLNNELLKNFSKEWNWSSVGQIFVNERMPNYTPLTIFSYALEKYFFAPDTINSPFIFHLDNILLHLGCTFLVFIFFLKLKINPWGSFFAALLFGIHPMKMESVAWITERKDVLYGFFFLLSLLTYIKFIESPTKKHKWYLLTVLFSLLSYLSKAQAVSLPLCMVVLDFFFGRRWLAFKTLILEKLPWWIFSIAIGIIGIIFVKGQDNSNSEILVNYTVIEKIAISCYSYGVYVIKFIFPYKMTYYSFPVHVPFIAYISLIMVPLILGYCLWISRKNKTIITGIALFTFNVIFMFQFPFAGAGYQADRFTYIAYIGLLLILGFGYMTAIKRFSSYKTTIHLGIGIYITVFICMTYLQNAVWRNGISFWENYIKENKDDYYGYFQVGSYYSEAILYQLPDPFINKNDPDLLLKPLKYLELARIKDSTNGTPYLPATAKIYINHGIANGLLGSYESGVADFTRALSILPGSKEAYMNRGWYYYLLKNPDLALADFTSYIRIDPMNDGVYYKRAVCEGDLQKFPESLSDINKAISINENNPEYYILRASLYQVMNDHEAMHADAEKARQLGGTVPENLFH